MDILCTGHSGNWTQWPVMLITEQGLRHKGGEAFYFWDQECSCGNRVTVEVPVVLHNDSGALNSEARKRVEEGRPAPGSRVAGEAEAAVDRPDGQAVAPCCSASPPSRFQRVKKALGLG